MKIHKDSGIILRRIDYGERDRILSVLCETRGKVSLIAKGVRSPKSKLAGGIELLSISELSFIEGKSDLMTLTSSRLQQHFESIVSNGPRLQQALRYLKLLNKIIDAHAGQEYYSVLSAGFMALNDTTHDEQVVEIWFNMRIMTHSGSWPNLEVSSGESFNFDYDKQQFIAAEEGQYSQNDLKLLRLSQTSVRPPRLQTELASISRLAALTSDLVKMNISEV